MYKQNIDRICTKWNTHPLQLRTKEYIRRQCEKQNCQVIILFFPEVNKTGEFPLKPLSQPAFRHSVKIQNDIQDYYLLRYIVMLCSFLNQLYSHHFQAFNSL